MWLRTDLAGPLRFTGWQVPEVSSRCTSSSAKDVPV